ncbi:MAG: DUF2167 domain-containing protein [Myxococcota bacterium]
MLHALIASCLLSFAPPNPADAPAQDIDAVGDAAAVDAPADEEPMDPAFAAMLASLSGDAQALLETMDEQTMDELLGNYYQDGPLTDAQRELAAAVSKLQIGNVDAGLNYRSGDVSVGDGLATLHLGEAFRYLGPDDARTMIVDVWGNPPEAGQTLGMIVPTDVSPAHPVEGWGVIITYTEDGHVEDDDAEDIDYDDLLEEMQADTKSANPDRERRGFPAMTLLGWAAAPHYDKESKRLYWAKELAVDGAPEHSLNYDIRVLGRKGVLELSAIGGMSQLPTIRPQMEQVLGTVEFDAGNRYSDFDPDVDAVAAYGIGGLVAGKLLAKAGFFAVILKFLIAAKKLIIVGFIAVGVFIKKMFSRGDS